MIISCANCGVKLKVDESKVKEGGSRLKCPKCANIFTVYRPEPAPAAGQVQTSAPAAPRPVPPPAPMSVPAAPPVVETPAPPPQPAAKPSVPRWQLDRRKVLVAHDSDSVLALIKGLLEETGYEVTTAREGVEAVVLIEREKPFLAILDVALPRIFGFEICDRLKNNGESSEVKVLLIASIYDKTRYKREPVSLYGADDYIEKHHIQDCILDKVKRLASGSGIPILREEEKLQAPPPEEAGMRSQQAAEMRREEMREFAAPSMPPSSIDPQQVEAARRFARIILSDIALYNQSAVEDGIRGGNFREVLAAELKEGRDLYNKRVPEDVRASMDYLEDEIQKFVEKKRNTMDLKG